MRISGGEYCGRNLKVPATDALRPTQDRVREAIFSMLQTVVPGSTFLDLFAGSGSVGIEALSRGAAKAVFVERDRRHASVLNDNLGTLKVARSAFDIVVADCYRWIGSYAGTGFDVAFADPPYALGEERGYASVLATLAGRNVVNAGGLFIAEMTAVQKPEETPGWVLLRDRIYGKTRICVWRRKNEE